MLVQKVKNQFAKTINGNMKNKKLLILAHMRSGKDTLAEILNKHFYLKFESSSMAALKIFIFDALKEQYGYKTLEECFNDRLNHRKEWYDLICDYNKEDKAKLAKKILEDSDCYVGMRDKNELDECIKQDLFSLIVWVDASERLPPESSESFKIDKSCADIIIDNNGTLEEFEKKVIRFGKAIKLKKRKYVESNTRTLASNANNNIC